MNKDDTEEEINVNKIPKPKEVPPKLSQNTINLLAEAAESAFNAENSVPQPPYPPTNPPKSLFDQNTKSMDGVDCPNGETNGEANGETNGEPNGEADEEIPL